MVLLAHPILQIIIVLICGEAPIQSGGIYQGNLADGVWLIDNTGSQLWVVEKDCGGPFNEPSWMPQDSYRNLADIPGVAKAASLIT